MAEQESETIEQEAPDAAAVEAEARTMGWCPKEEWRGKPEAWKPADVFLEHGHTVLPILRSQNKQLEAKVNRLLQAQQELAEKLEARDRDLTDFEAFHKEEVQRRVTQTRDEIKRQLREAKADGDHGAEVELTDQLTRLNAADTPTKDKAKVEEKPAAKVDPKIDAAWNAFIGRHPELAADVDLQDEVEILARKVRRANPDLVYEPFWEEVEKAMGAKRPARSKVDSGAGGTRRPAATDRRTYDDLDREAKAACDANVKRFVKKGGKWETPESYRAHFVKQLEDTNYFN